MLKMEIHKKVVAVPPYFYPNTCNFKYYPYEAWKLLGGRIAKSHYPYKGIRYFVHKYGVPNLFLSRSEARLRFVEACSLNFDTWPDSLFYEIIPLVWDCWPQHDCKLIEWFQKNNVKLCVFTCEEASYRIQKALPELKILTITEGINVDRYSAGLDLKDREIDFYSYGRAPESISNFNSDKFVVKRNGSDDEFSYRCKHSKLVYAVPQCDVLPVRTGGQETLTQRFWECMLSRMLIVGRAPKELQNLLGYDPTLPIDIENLETNIDYYLNNIDSYQKLVDKNRRNALRCAPWSIRMKQIMYFLRENGYDC